MLRQTTETLDATRTELAHTQGELHDTRTQLRITEADLARTKADLDATRIELGKQVRNAAASLRLLCYRPKCDERSRRGTS
jgi:septal ring factor EnvC (AmiA/AmiB activator)